MRNGLPPFWNCPSQSCPSSLTTPRIRATLERAGTPIAAYDILIAAQARRRGATLVTANGREFARVPRLKTDWTAA
jgi:predicted nucleic acid-binding protein